MYVFREGVGEMSTTDNFFDEQKDQSAIKTAIVANFYSTYIKIINNSVGKNCDCLYYVDLFTGPGKYLDGKDSTPLKVLDIIQNQNLKNKVVCIFNEKDSSNYDNLLSNLEAHEIYLCISNLVPQCKGTLDTEKSRFM